MARLHGHVIAYVNHIKAAIELLQGIIFKHADLSPGTCLAMNVTLDVGRSEVTQSADAFLYL